MSIIRIDLANRSYYHGQKLSRKRGIAWTQQRPRRPIQGSVAGASIALHNSVAVFKCAIHCTLDEIIQDEVII